jgi:membrane protein DedA with SNARE-associated domain
MVFNFIGAALWAPLVAGVGYVFGSAVESALVEVDGYEMWLFGGVAAAGAMLFIAHRLRRRG